MVSSASAPASGPVTLSAEGLRPFVVRLFRAAGLSANAADTMADALLEADLEGLPSHGVMQAEVYLDRMRLGSVSPGELGEVVHDQGAVAVIDSHHILGHLAGNQAMALAIAKAKEFGLGAVAVRHAFHFGPAGRYARQAADQGCIGMAMCNSRPMMPAPGGAQPLFGTNPVAISVPTPTPPHVVLDMATSAGTVGRMRLAAKSGKPIPDGWAVDAQGNPTNDAEEGLKGMLLPMAGPKGFGLSMIVDMISGMLSGGAWGDDVPGLHVDLTKPFDTCHFFLAMDVAHFRPLGDFLADSQGEVDRVRGSRKAPGVSRIYTPGERKWEAGRQSGGKISLQGPQIDKLRRLAGDFGVDTADFDALVGGK